MNRVAEQELKDSLKKSEFRGIIATVGSTVTVLIGMFFGGMQIVDAVKTSIRIEVDAKIKDLERQLAELKSKAEAKV